LDHDAQDFRATRPGTAPSTPDEVTTRAARWTPHDYLDVEFTDTLNDKPPVRPMTERLLDGLGAAQPTRFGRRGR
jgi:hypothetical protein